MNFYRRILMAPASLHHWKKVVTAPPPSSGIQNCRIWKVACSIPAAAPFSTGVETSEVTLPPIKSDLCDGASSSAEKAKVAASNMVKRKIFEKLKSLTVETVDLIIREDNKNGLYVGQGDLIGWIKILTNKFRKPENARSSGGWIVRGWYLLLPSLNSMWILLPRLMA
ncbi:PREDICTED: uncharacterized protein LOC104759154 isoform X1 [Camelina sativa]|uniref:Uncharacterized protein LOC104759154 isoform X1 n=1 Tax=Camelina sativa TaxID=90675 RepID=A0ABM1R6V8_CAMSA|nr:PREDICTED: uncharacterized protein LOC104759154 isoform X1 [Camelina sativa]